MTTSTLPSPDKGRDRKNGRTEAVGRFAPRCPASPFRARLSELGLFPVSRCWEWTATKRSDGKNAVKGGAFDAKRTDCRTEAKAASRGGARGYPNVTIRLVRETK